MKNPVCLYRFLFAIAGVAITGVAILGMDDARAADAGITGLAGSASGAALATPSIVGSAMSGSAMGSLADSMGGPYAPIAIDPVPFVMPFIQTGQEVDAVSVSEDDGITERWSNGWVSPADTQGSLP